MARRSPTSLQFDEYEDYLRPFHSDRKYDTPHIERVERVNESEESANSYTQIVPYTSSERKYEQFMTRREQGKEQRSVKSVASKECSRSQPIINNINIFMDQEALATNPTFLGNIRNASKEGAKEATEHIYTENKELKERIKEMEDEINQLKKTNKEEKMQAYKETNKLKETIKKLENEIKQLKKTIKEPRERDESLVVVRRRRQQIPENSKGMQLMKRH